MKSGYRVKQKYKKGFIIKLNLFIKPVRIEPCVVERKNRFDFEKITFDLSPLNTAKIIDLI